MKQSTDRILTACVLFIAALQMTLMVQNTPYLYDDLVFWNAYNTFSEGSDDFDLSAMMRYITELRQYDNSRISNMLSPFTTIFEPFRTIFPVICGLIWAFSLWAIVRIIGFKERLFIPTAMLWIVTFLFLPWRNNIYVADYQLNYTFSTAVTLGFILLLKAASQHRSWLLFGLSVCMSILAGGWHEGFAVPILVGLGVYAAVHRFKLPRKWYFITTVYLTATIIFALSPGMISRFTAQYGKEPVVRLASSMADISITAIMIVSVCLAVAIPAWRRRLSNVWHTFGFTVFFTAAIVGTTISFAILHTPRMSFWPSLCSIIVLSQIFKPFIVSQRRYRIYAILSAIGVLGCIIVSIHALDWQIRLRDEHTTIMSKFGETGNNLIVYHDVIMPEDVPLTTLYLPTRSIWITDFNYISLDSYFNREGHCVIPSALRAANPKHDVLISGNVKAYLCGNALWAPNTPDFIGKYANNSVSSGMTHLDITMDNGTKLDDVPTYISRFTSSANQQLIYLKPFRVPANRIRSLNFSIRE